MARLPRTGWPMLVIGVLALAAGCQTPTSPGGQTVERAWDASPQTNAAPAQAVRRTASDPKSPWPGDDWVAVVDGNPIDRSRVVDLIWDGHGAPALEHIIAYDRAARLAAVRGLSVSRQDVQAEYERTLRLLQGSDGSAGSAPLEFEASEALLRRILADRNISRAEYMLSMRRNAYLRKIAAAEVRFDEQQVRDEYSRMFGEQVEIRHIQLDSRAQVDRVLRERSAGTDFAELARRYSANPQSAARGGLLEPFTADDPAIPAPLRSAAFALAVGEESGPIFLDGWHHLIRVERRLPARQIPPEQVRPEVERRLRERLTAAAMQRLSEELLREEGIEILDPALRESFNRRRQQASPQP